MRPGTVANKGTALHDIYIGSLQDLQSPGDGGAFKAARPCSRPQDTSCPSTKGVVLLPLLGLDG